MHADNFRTVMRKWFGQGRAYSFEWLASMTGIPIRRLRGFVDGSQYKDGPTLQDAMTIINAMPIEFKLQALQTIGLAYAEWECPVEKMCYGDWQVLLQQFSLMGARHWSDGKISVPEGLEFRESWIGMRAGAQRVMAGLPGWKEVA